MKKRIFSTKKAMTQEQLVLLAEFVIPLIIGALLFAWVNDTTTNAGFDKKYVARDTSLVTSTLVSSPGTIHYNYILGKFYVFSFDPYRLSVGLDAEDRFPAYYIYSKPKNLEIDAEHILKIEKELSFVKTEDTLAINQEDVFLSLPCPEIELKKISSVGIDPYPSEKPSDAVFQISEAAAILLRGSVDEVIRTRQVGEERTVDRLQSAETLIGIRANPNSPYLKIYYSLDSAKNIESRKLGCTIANNILESFEFQGVAVIGINPQDLVQGSQEFILSSDKMAILIELGTKYNEAYLSEHVSEMAKALSLGVNSDG